MMKGNLNLEDQEILSKLINFLKQLEDANPFCKFYLGGGCLRDLHFKGSFEETKDYDIFAVPKRESFLEFITKEMKLVSYCEHKVITANYLPDMLERNVVKLIQGYADGVLKPVDIIVYNQHLTPEGLAGDFDFNVNQCVIDSRGSSSSTEAFKEAKGSLKLIQTKKYCPERMKERYQRMLTRLGSSWS